MKNMLLVFLNVKKKISFNSVLLEMHQLSYH